MLVWKEIADIVRKAENAGSQDFVHSLHVFNPIKAKFHVSK